jgi:LysR family transcriptional regulator, glycine cleavage system transcriptional activator
MTNCIDVPLTAFRVFVTIGRQGNFTRAAAALGITQSGVSRQVAKLESLANTSLFKRKGATVAFTPAGQDLYDTLKDAISTIELTAQHLSQRGRLHDRLIVRTSMPSFAMKVVAPFLSSYAVQYGVQIDLVTSMVKPHPQDAFDVLITRNLALPGTESWELVREKLVCVASPALAEARGAGLNQRWPMIASSIRPDVLSAWAIAQGISAEQLIITATYDHFFLAIEAAIGGVGCLVVPQMLVRDQLLQGILVLADDMILASGASYIAYVNPRSEHVEIAEKFCRWLKGILRDSDS